MRKNRKYCTVCKGLLIETENFDTQEEEDDLELDTLPHKRLNLDHSDHSKNMNVNFSEMKPKEKSDLYENVRNHYSKEEPVIESSGVVMVNPVFDYMLDKAGLSNKFSHCIKFEDDDSITITHSEKEDHRVFIVVTCDGLPHLLAIKIIENCYVCEECNLKFETLLSVSVHKKSTNHLRYQMQYGNIILRIGGFHMELTMHRSYVKLNWEINYSQIARFANFNSPKGQYVMKHVSDLNKSTDLFMASRTAKIRELLVPYIKECKLRNKIPDEKDFDQWLHSEVKDENYKLCVQIESLYGTSL